MAYVINDDCISCGACAAGCPVEAISEGAAHYEINADACIDCGACAGTCPVGAPNPQQFEDTLLLNPPESSDSGGFLYSCYIAFTYLFLNDLF